MLQLGFSRWRRFLAARAAEFDLRYGLGRQDPRFRNKRTL